MEKSKGHYILQQQIVGEQLNPGTNEEEILNLFHLDKKFTDIPRKAGMGFKFNDLIYCICQATRQILFM